MLSKCANPECFEVLRYISARGKIFYLAPTPEVTIATGMLHPEQHERFWLCARCSKKMTLIWGGAQVRVVRLPSRAAAPVRLKRKLQTADFSSAFVRVRGLIFDAI